MTFLIGRKWLIFNLIVVLTLVLKSSGQETTNEVDQNQAEKSDAEIVPENSALTEDEDENGGSEEVGVDFEKDAWTDVDFGVCRKVSVSHLQETLKKLIEDPTASISGKDYACTILTLLRQNEVQSADIHNLKKAVDKIEEDVSEVSIMRSTLNSNTDKLSSFEKLQEKTRTETTEKVIAVEKSLASFVRDQSTKTDRELEIFALQITSNTRDLMEIKNFFNETFSTAEDHVFTLETALADFVKRGQSWEEISIDLTNTIKELATRASKTELEIVNKINHIVEQIIQVEDRLHTSIQNETDRSIQVELSINSQITQKYHQITEKLTKLENITGEDQKILNDLQKQVNKIKPEWTTLKDRIDDELQNANKNLQSVVLSPFKLLETLETELKTKLNAEISRATKAESAITDSIRSQVGLHTSGLKTNLDNEIRRATFAENNLQKLFSEQRDKLKVFEQDFKTQMDIESLRAKGTEAQLSSIITAEVERAKQSESEINQILNANVTRLQTDIINEYNRATSTEEKLEKKLVEEISRAISTESNLLGNINEELKRASEKEEQLHQFIYNGHEKLQKLEESLRKDLENEITRSKAIDDDLLSQVSNQSKKIDEVEDELTTALTEEITRARKVEVGLRESIDHEGNRAKEFEMGVLSTVMAEVVRAGDFEKNLRANLTQEIERAEEIENLLKSSQISNFTRIDTKLESIIQLIEEESKKREEISREVSRNFTTHLLVLADEMDNKLEVANQTAELRFEKLDADFKKCCSSSWSSWRNPASGSSTSSGGGVFNRVLGLFGGRRNTTATSTTPSNSNSTSKKSSAKSKEGRRDDMALGEVELNALLNDGDANKEKVNVKDVISVEEFAANAERRFFPNSNSNGNGKSGRTEDESARSMPVFIHRSNSKVRNIYG